MNIYFVNRNSTLKGPFDITDHRRQKIIRIGDVVLRETTKGIMFNVVVSNDNKWGLCQCIDITEETLHIEGNTLLFSFDGITKRTGNLRLLNELKKLFQKQPVCDFLENAISILSYKCDLWNLEIFCEMQKLAHLDDMQQNKAPLMRVENAVKEDIEYLFVSYLDEKSKLLFKTLFKHNKKLKDIYIEIRKQFPQEFRKSIITFQRNHPSLTIYEKIK